MPTLRFVAQSNISKSPEQAGRRIWPRVFAQDSRPKMKNLLPVHTKRLDRKTKIDMEVSPVEKRNEQRHRTKTALSRSTRESARTLGVIEKRRSTV